MLDYRELAQKIKSQDIVSLSRAITLNESTRLEDNLIIDKLLSENRQNQDKSIVLAISGIPGVGKSTFIESLGQFLVEEKKRVAIFTIDPSSEISKGSILGDKTRMEKLAASPKVFIRPSPNSNILGGVGLHTHKNIELAKLAGYDVIIVESVGIGQSEFDAYYLSDLFILLIMPSSGDELQGIKKGIMESPDLFIVHKADGELREKALQTQSELESALHYVRTETPPILIYSSTHEPKSESIWSEIETLFKQKDIPKLRNIQRQFWFQKDANSIIAKYYQLKYKAQLDTLTHQISEGEFKGIQDILNLIKD